MANWTEAQRQDIVKRLQERGVSRPCSRCGSDKFALVEGYAVFGMVPALEAESVQNLVPSAVVACGRCGYLTFHALGALGLLSKDQPLPPGTRQEVVDAGTKQEAVDSGTNRPPAVQPPTSAERPAPARS
ncbi:MAG: hypothetical protein IT463_13830 [Planctomycetes bacterium]|nr:hypothetical protein [Planctomycetota bacterium]